jgi:hypothetical protein
MGSKSLLLSSVHGQTVGQASGGYSCAEKYDWQNLSLHQSEQAAREQLDHDATLHCPLDMPSRLFSSSVHEIKFQIPCYIIMLLIL